MGYLFVVSFPVTRELPKLAADLDENGDFGG